MQAPEHRPAKEDIDPGVQDLVPRGHTQVDEQLVLCGPRQLPGEVHDRWCLQQGLHDEDLQERKVVLCDPGTVGQPLSCCCGWVQE